MYPCICYIICFTFQELIYVEHVQKDVPIEQLELYKRHMCGKLGINNLEEKFYRFISSSENKRGIFPHNSFYKIYIIAETLAVA